MKTKLLPLVIAVSCSIFLHSKSALAQSAPFAYQGQLVAAGLPANGSFDLSFTLFTTNVDGVGIAGPVTNTATPVKHGLFTVILDFGSGVFAGSNYWLEVAVQTNNGTGYTTLSPRQPITLTPYALFAWSAGTALTAASATTVAEGGTVPLTALPGAVVTNGATNVDFTGIFTGDGSGLTNLDDSQLYSGTNTWTGANTWLGLSTFTSGNIFMGTNAAFTSGPDGLDGIFTNTLLTLFAPSVGKEMALEIYGDYRNGVSGERYQSGFSAGNPGFHTTGGILLNGDNSIQYIPDAINGMLAIGQDVTHGYVQFCYYPYFSSFELFTSPDGIGEPTDGNYPNGMQTFNINANGFTTIWKRGDADLGSMLQLIENDYTATNAFGFDVYPDGLYLGPIIGSGTNATHTNPMVIGNNGDLFVSGRINGDGSGLTNIPAASITGAIPDASLPRAAVTNGAKNVVFSGRFNGDGSGLINLNASRASVVFTNSTGTNTESANGLTNDNTASIVYNWGVHSSGSISNLVATHLTASSAITNNGNSWLFYGGTNFTAGTNAYDFWVTNKLTTGSAWTVVSDSTFAGTKCAVYLEVDISWCNPTNMAGYTGYQRWNDVSYNTTVGGNATAGALNAITADACVYAGAPTVALTGAGTTNVGITIANPSGTEMNSDYQAHVLVRRMPVF